MSADMLVAMLAIVALVSIGAWSALKPRRTTRRSATPERPQPVPDVTAQDVKRIVHRDFPDPEFEGVMATLAEYTGQWENGVARVQIAALKLANGDIESLRKYISAAKIDYRDVLVAAEYPAYWKATARSRTLPKKELQRAIDADSQQYNDWLRR